MEYYHKCRDTPVGRLALVANERGIAAILWEEDDPGRVPIDKGILNNDHPMLLEAEKQLNEYFDKSGTEFSLALDFTGTEFQKKVWEALLTIPFGLTRSYGQIARQVNCLKAVRAVGAAANKNPISIIAPCHRVVGGSGKLVGFAGGLEHKAWLLRLEDSRKSPTLW